MDIENKTDSVFTDKTNTIPKKSSVKQIFTKRGTKLKKKASKDKLDLATKTCDVASFKSFYNKGIVRSITPTKRAVTKLMLSDGEDMGEEDPVGSVHADSVNEPDQAISQKMDEEVTVFQNGEKMVEEAGELEEEEEGDIIGGKRLSTPSRIPNKCLVNLSEPKPEDGTVVEKIPKD